MTEYKFEENADEVKRIRWGAWKPQDEGNEDNFLLVKKGQKLRGEITVINIHDFEQDDGTNQSKPIIILKKLDDDKEVTFVPPARLQTALGLNPSWTKKHVAKEGDVVEITYLGVDSSAKGNPHTFKVGFAATK